MVNPSICCVLVFLSVVTLGSCADKYTDGNRPYKFGFNIEGEQHRHETKDENGIIMGEFGFLTADGVYHVTVYATDENGNFKILSMKNIRVKPFPTAATSPAPPPRIVSQALQLPARGNAIAQSPTRGITGQSCSHCSLPSSTATPQLQGNPQGGSVPSSFGQTQQFGQASQFGHGPPLGQGQFNQNQHLYHSEVTESFTQTEGRPSFGGDPNDRPKPSRQDQPFNQGPSGNTSPVSNNIGSSSQQGIAPSYSGNINNPEKPILISANMKIVERPVNLNEKAPGEKDGLPAGLSSGDMLELLYTFNYTLGFHAHHEVGYRNGFKKGYYFVTGRDGVKTKVEYEADAQGYRPKIIKENLGLESQDVPKVETEKEVKYGLKGYEFKWLYFPKEDAKQRFRQ